MTKLQRLLFAFGAARFKRFRRWVGGRWVEVRNYRGPTGTFGFELEYRCGAQWQWDPNNRYRLIGLPGAVHVLAIEQWPVDLPKATSVTSTKIRRAK